MPPRGTKRRAEDNESEVRSALEGNPEPSPYRVPANEYIALTTTLNGVTDQQAVPTSSAATTSQIHAQPIALGMLGTAKAFAQAGFNTMTSIFSRLEAGTRQLPDQILRIAPRRLWSLFESRAQDGDNGHLRVKRIKLSDGDESNSALSRQSLDQPEPAGLDSVLVGSRPLSPNHETAVSGHTWASPDKLAQVAREVQQLQRVLTAIHDALDDNIDPTIREPNPVTRFVAGASFTPFLERLSYPNEPTPPSNSTYLERRDLLCRAIKKTEISLCDLYGTLAASAERDVGVNHPGVLSECFSREARRDHRLLLRFMPSLKDLCDHVEPACPFPGAALEMVLEDLEALNANKLMPSLYIPTATRQSPQLPSYHAAPTSISSSSSSTISLPGGYPNGENKPDIPRYDEYECSWAKFNRTVGSAPMIPHNEGPFTGAIQSKLATNSRLQAITAWSLLNGRRPLTEGEPMDRSFLNIRDQTAVDQVAGPSDLNPVRGKAGDRPSIDVGQGTLADCRARARLFEKHMTRLKYTHLPYAAFRHKSQKHPARAKRESPFTTSSPIHSVEVDEADTNETLSEDPNQALSPGPWPDGIDGIADLRISELATKDLHREREEKERIRSERRRLREEERKREAEEKRRREEEEARKQEEARQQAEEQRLREEALRQGGLRAPKKALFPTLSPYWTARVRATQQLSGTIAKTPEADLQQHDFQRLVPPTVWLNDSVVNGSLLWLDKFINEAAGITDVKAQTRKCLVLGSFFYKRLGQHGVTGTERTLRRNGVTKDNLLDIETILMPICQHNHWTLVVIQPQKRTISHLDSLNPKGSQASMVLASQWLKAVLGTLYVEEEWRSVKYSTPHQTNGWDCGVHTILNGMCLALGVDPLKSYNSGELPTYRQQVAALLLNNGFTGEFNLANI